MVNIEKSIREKNLRFVDERFFGEVSYLAVLLSIFLIGPILGLISPIIYIDKTNEVFNATRDIVIASALIFFFPILPIDILKNLFQLMDLT